MAGSKALSERFNWFLLLILMFCQDCKKCCDFNENISKPFTNWTIDGVKAIVDITHVLMRLYGLKEMSLYEYHKNWQFGWIS